MAAIPIGVGDRLFVLDDPADWLTVMRDPEGSGSGSQEGEVREARRIDVLGVGLVAPKP